ncbi:isthmin-2 [Ascaphus truei]|uniref:isthmin-2 n=1 Tax=Ascaphus truei TaxID=8439 RepID=UPI003F5972A2
MSGLPALLLPCVLLLTPSLELLGGAPTRRHRDRTPGDLQVNGESDLPTVPGENVPVSNQVTHEWRGISPNRPRRYRRRGSQPAVRSHLHPSPSSLRPGEDSPFILDLQSLSEANLSSENPNIQVTIEVVPDSRTEFELDLSDSRTDWNDSDWASQHELFWPLFWEYSDLPVGPPEHEDEDASQYDWEDTVLSGVGGDWDPRRPPESNWISEDKYQYDYEEEDWSPWSPCSSTCGDATQKRLRSCGYSCTATESRSCDLSPCAGEEQIPENSTQELAPSADAGTPSPGSAHMDSCDRWLTCKSDFLGHYLHRVLTELPSCPCSYPSEAVYSAVTLRDEALGRSFRWRDASGVRERLDIYNPGAQFCLRSMLSRDSSSLGAQHCCYDQTLRLITRGQAAGNPNLISTDLSPELHYKADVLPWILCKGDWSRIHSLRPPNNGRGCPESPPEGEYLSQLQEAREY